MGDRRCNFFVSRLSLDMNTPLIWNRNAKQLDHVEGESMRSSAQASDTPSVPKTTTRVNMNPSMKLAGTIQLVAWRTFRTQYFYVSYISEQY